MGWFIRNGQKRYLLVYCRIGIASAYGFFLNCDWMEKTLVGGTSGDILGVIRSTYILEVLYDIDLDYSIINF